MLKGEPDPIIASPQPREAVAGRAVAAVVAAHPAAELEAVAAERRRNEVQGDYESFDTRWGTSARGTRSDCSACGLIWLNPESILAGPAANVRVPTTTTPICSA